MLIFPEHGLTYLATPKTGTTAVHLSLQGHADIVFKGPRKHMTARRYRKHVEPFLRKAYGVTPETVAVMRNPVEQLRSWYKYRSRENIAGSDRSTTGMSFDDYVQAVVAPNPPEHAQVGSQFKFLTDHKGKVLVTHLFDYDNQTGLVAFLSGKLGCDVRLGRHNVSPDIDAPLSVETEMLLRARREKEFALYDALKSANGYLRADVPDAPPHDAPARAARSEPSSP